ncbi:MAG: hypothetical protein R3E93_15920 [Thiothrix sp.]
MSNLQQFELFAAMPEPAQKPVKPVIGLHWYKPDGSPLLCNNGLPAKYEFEGVLWSGRGRMPWVIDCHWPNFRSIANGLADIEAGMEKRGYRRVQP